MGKIFSLREWFYLEDACKQLSERFSEPVTVGDLLALALDGRLSLSVRVRYGINVRAATLTNEKPAGVFQEDYVMTGVEDRIFLSLSKKVDCIDGLFDLPMLGGEKEYISDFEWHGNTEGKYFGASFDEVVLRSQSGQLYVLVAPNVGAERVQPWDSWKNYSFSYNLPQAARLVVRLKAMLDLESSLQPTTVAKPLDVREQTGLLNIIGAMLELLQTPRAGRVDDAAIVREMVDNYGDKYGISESNLNRKFPAAKRSLSAS